MTNMHETPLDLVAEQIGENVSADDVAEVVDMARMQELLFHGIKRSESLPAILRSGIEARTPQGGLVSYWGHGSRLLYASSPTRDSAFWSRGSVFFDYGHPAKSGNMFRMSFAITDINKLEENGIALTSYEPDGECTISQRVDSALLTILKVEASTIARCRLSMFELLHTGMRAGKLLSSRFIELHN